MALPDWSFGRPYFVSSGRVRSGLVTMTSYLFFKPCKDSRLSVSRGKSFRSAFKLASCQHTPNSVSILSRDNLGKTRKLRPQHDTSVAFSNNFTSAKWTMEEWSNYPCPGCYLINHLQAPWSLSWLVCSEILVAVLFNSLQKRDLSAKDSWPLMFANFLWYSTVTYSSLRFTVDLEVNNELPFMDVLVDVIMESLQRMHSLECVCTYWSKDKSYRVTNLSSTTNLFLVDHSWWFELTKRNIDKQWLPRAP